jgi:CelD/BcsL family acetyltransferase involved in cellulose biosynthesis
MLAWWREFGEDDGRSLRVVAVEEDGELLGLLPLSYRSAAHRRAIPVRRLELLATGEDEADEIGSDYVGGLAAKGFEDVVAQAVAAALLDGRVGEWDELRMSAMSAQDPLVASLEASFRAKGVTVRVDPSGESPFIPLPSSWDEYMRVLGSSRRYVVARTLRELETWSGGDWQHRTACSAEELAEGTRVLRSLHAERWTAMGRAGVFASSRFARFHEAVMPRLLAREDGAALELSWLVVRGQPIAAAYNIVYANKVYFYQSGRAVDVPKGVRPGIALHAIAIRKSIEAGRLEYDFLAGTSRYKLGLSLAARPLVTLRAIGPSLRARGVEAMRAATELAVARMRAVRRRAGPPAEERAPE